MLVGDHVEQIDGLALGQHRQALLVVLVVRLILAVGIDRDEAGLHQHRTIGAEGMIRSRAQLGGDGVVHRLRHLAGDGSLPDQFVETGLIRRQRARDVLRQTRGRRGTDRLMRFLRVLGLRLEMTWLGRNRAGAVLAGDGLAYLLQGVLGQIHRVGTHIGNQADRLAVDLGAFVELLRGAHGALRGEAELAVGLLLQGRGRERRRGIAAPLLLVDLGDQQLAVGRLEQCALGAHRADHRGDRELLDLARRIFDQTCRELLAILVDARLHGPVLARNEGLDLFFTFADQAQCRALHAAGRQAGRDLAPQQRR